MRTNDSRYMNFLRGRPRRPRRGLVLGAAAVTFAAGAAAQESSVMQEVTVTATKRAESVQDVAISIAAYSGDQLRELGLQESTDVARITPGVYIGGSIGGQTSLFTIRGVTQNDFTDSVESPVAVYIDEGYVAMGQGQMFGLFDIERVEVAKGPQGTLFGRNATGGLVHYVSRKPTRELDGYVDLSFGEFSSVRAEGAVSGPLGEALAGRLSFLYNKFDPILNNIIDRSTLPGGLGGDDEWNDETYAARAQLMLTPREGTEITFAAFGAKSEVSTAPYQSSPTVPVFDQQGRLVDTINASPTETREAILLDASGRDTGLALPGGIAAVDGDFDDFRPVPGGDLFGYVDADGEGFDYSKDLAFEDLNEFETKGASIRWYEELANGMTFASITDYKDYEKFVNMDVDAAPYPQAMFYSQAEADTLSQEFRLSGNTERMKWVTGLYYLSIDNETRNGLGFPAGSPFSTIIFGTSLDTVGFINLETKSYSLFGQVDYALNDRWTLVAGARAVREEKDYSFEQAAFLNTDDRYIDTATRAVTLFPFMAYETSDTLWAGKLQLEFRPSDDLLWYAGINRGVKAGSFNAQLADGSPRLPLDEIPYEPEELTSYEVGFKSTLFDGKARLNGAAYFYDYSDYQAFLFVLSSGTVTNKDAEMKGVELELVTNPISGLDLAFGLSAFEAEVQDLELRGGAPGVEPIRRDVKPSFAPELQASALVRYTWALPAGSLALQLDGSYTDEFYHNLRNFAADRYDSYSVGNVRLGYRNADETWEIAAFVRNFTDERYKTIGYDLATLCGCNEDAYGKPRWAGVSFNYNFGARTER